MLTSKVSDFSQCSFCVTSNMFPFLVCFFHTILCLFVCLKKGLFSVCSLFDLTSKSIAQISLNQSQTHIDRQTHTHTYTHTHRNYVSPSLSLSLTHTHTVSLSLSHAQTHTHTSLNAAFTKMQGNFNK